MNRILMNRVLSSVLLTTVTTIATSISIASAQTAAPQASQPQPLTVVYPPTTHETTAAQIFLIGSAAPQGQVLVNGKAIARNQSGHFAPSFPLQAGANRFTVRYNNQELTFNITRKSAAPTVPAGSMFVKESLTPAVDQARLPNELICFNAIAVPNATVSVKLANQIIPLQPSSIASISANSGVLTGKTQPNPATPGQFSGCATSTIAGDLGQPEYQFTVNGTKVAQAAPGKISVLSPAQLTIGEVSAEQGTARTGPSTDYSRMTPLPKGTRATITGTEGEWLRFDYGGWIKASEVKVTPNSAPARSLIRGITSRVAGDWTEVLFPLQTPVPVTVQQGDKIFDLVLYNTTAQTDTIKLVNNPIISRLDWQQTDPDKINYRITLRNAQQWGYKLRYEGTTLVLSLKNPPERHKSDRQGFAGKTIVIDPGHGGPEDKGSVGPTGYPEKDATLFVSKLVRDELVKRGAKVVMTRDADVDVDLPPRVDAIHKSNAAIALSLHFNALPDDGDAIKTKGVAAFWYQPQAYSLAAFMHDYIVKKLNRPSDGVFWNNLALTRPTVTPAVMLELGYMINPDEFDWIRNVDEQKKLAIAIVDGLGEWFAQSR